MVIRIYIRIYSIRYNVVGFRRVVPCCRVGFPLRV